MSDVELRRLVCDTVDTLSPGIDWASLRADIPLREQIELDSIDWINVIEALARRTHLNIPESDHPRLETLDGIVAYLSTHTRGSGP